MGIFSKWLGDDSDEDDEDDSIYTPENPGYRNNWASEALTVAGDVDIETFDNENLDDGDVEINKAEILHATDGYLIVELYGRKDIGGGVEESFSLYRRIHISDVPEPNDEEWDVIDESLGKP